ncbi:M20/M25/M40 family metallo-hydrolase [Alterisphingorhabdus coralli]|uniref:Carboxypeptidase Q n=1 Tax=Alterisphingorhabdus coralli TaxID=3071408 RepID=A0AA97F6M0_9SPHN|nr:M20/M25/M40 family metallo-hydrolase [Parasphingorhabdus sp. SCSIO 66989]WOE74067.1 M20/M25/M40 family metallo-hydrolase [Parasphingorhabdus sp. SCSIO 66989]
MKRKTYGFATLIPALLLASPALAQHDPAALQAKALEDDTAYDIVEGLTTEVGHRLAGTEDEARARDWAVQKLASLGFENIRVEPFTLPVWVRGEEEAYITSPFPHKMHITALGNSASTGEDGLEAEIAYFPTLADLSAARDGSLEGKIAFVSHKMTKTMDGSSYGAFGGARFIGPRIASQKGAAAIIIRSVGTDYHRNPHTGGTSFANGDPIPAAAISIPDAENLERVIARGKPVTVKLKLTPRTLGELESGNVITEIPGSDPNAPIIVIGGHLDSWDLGTGAVDDGAGVAITTAAAKLVKDAGQPKRTIRLIWFGSEEVGIYGGRAYAEKHGAAGHAIAMESDFGAGRIWRVEFKLPEGNDALKTEIANALAPLGIGKSEIMASGGPDNGPLVRLGVNAIDLQQDGTDYFDLHHTPDDTLDKIDPKAMQQNVAAWATVLSIIANSDADIAARPVEPEG